MENQQNPYETPVAGDPAMQGMPVQRSGIPKVFGILHIIYAAIGGLVALIGLGGGALLKTTFDALKTEAEKEGQDIAAMTDAIDELASISMIQSGISVIFAILLLVAGIQLVRYRASGRKLSNVWAIARIVVAIPVSFMAVKAQTKFQEEIQKISTDGPALDISSFASAGAIVGILLISIYPVLSLIFVNQPKAKEALN